MTTSKEELQALNETQVKELLVQSSQIVKKYIDERDEATKTELQEVIVDELSGIEGLGSDLEKLKSLSEAFVSVFDADKDGNITPDEIIAKVSLLQANIDKVAGDLSSLDGMVDELKTKLSVNEANIKSAQTDVTTLQATVKNELFTKDEVKEILAVDTGVVIKAVEDVFFPSGDTKVV